MIADSSSDAGQQGRSTDSAADPSQRGRVLVVDDDSAVRSSLCALLADDFEVQSAPDIAEAEVVLVNNEFDVVVTDFDMPGGTGLDLLRKVGPRFPDMLSVLVTGHAEHPDVRSAEMGGAVVRTIHKPYDPARLLRLVENTVNLARMKKFVNRLRTA